MSDDRASDAHAAPDPRTFLDGWLRSAPTEDPRGLARLLLAHGAPSFLRKVRGEEHLKHLLENAAFAPWTNATSRTIVDVDVIAASARATIRSCMEERPCVDYVLGATWIDTGRATGSATGLPGDDPSPGWRITGLSPASRTWD